MGVRTVIHRAERIRGKITEASSQRKAKKMGCVSRMQRYQRQQAAEREEEKFVPVLATPRYLSLYRRN